MMGQAKKRGSKIQRAAQAKQRSGDQSATPQPMLFDEETQERMGLSEQSLPAHLVKKLQEVSDIWVLIDGERRSFAEIVSMCFDVGSDLSSALIAEAMQNQEHATVSDIDRYNEHILSAGVDDFLRYACQELMGRAIVFEELVDQYENIDDGRMRAAEESGFITFGPVLTAKLCKSFSAELESVRLLAEKITITPTSIEVVQLVALIAGLKALRISTDRQQRVRFNEMFKSSSALIEDIGAELLVLGIPIVRAGLDKL